MKSKQGQETPKFSNLEQKHKLFTSKLVIPAMSIISLSFYASVVSHDVNAYIVAGLGFCVTLMNYWVTTLLGRWRNDSFSMRADAIDATRWLFNLLIFDTLIMVLLTSYHYNPSLHLDYSFNGGFGGPI